MRVGIVGLGLLGKALSARLLGAGEAVAGFDLSSAACAAAAAFGVAVKASAAAVAAEAEVLLLSLPHDEARRGLLWGAQDLGGQLREGMLVFDTTTSAPADFLQDHARLAERGVRLVDLTVVGSSEQTARGEAVLLAGGGKEDLPVTLLQTLASRIFYLDTPGQACRMKLVVNLVLGLNRLVLAEGLALAERAGLDAGLALEVLKSGGAYSRVMDTKGEKMLTRDYAPVARLAQHAKDVRLIGELARGCGARAPLSALHAEVLSEACEAGLGELDNAAVIEVFRQMHGTR